MEAFGKVGRNLEHCKVWWSVCRDLRTPTKSLSQSWVLQIIISIIYFGDLRIRGKSPQGVKTSR